MGACSFECEGSPVAIAARLLGFWREGRHADATRRRRAPVKPSGLAYGVDESPPRFLLWMSALQHVLIATTVGMFLPLLVLDAAKASPETAEGVMSVCMLVLGLGTVLLSLGARHLGSGYLMPASFSGVYFSVTILAAKQGGLPLVAGMTMFAGLVQLLLSRIVHRLRTYLPTEIAGFAMLLSGFTLAVVGFNMITGVAGPDDAIAPQMDLPALLGVCCALVMMGLHVWGTSAIRTYIVLIALAGGSVAAFALGVAPPFEAGLSDTGVLRLPERSSGWPLLATNLLLPFAIAAIASSLRAVGDLTTVQKVNDARWQRPDMTTIRNGLAANGLATIAAGALGTMALGTTSGSVGASVATGVTSRVVGLAAGVLFVAFAFVPAITDLLTALPRPVIGATLVFSSCFINLTAMQVMTSRLLDERRTLMLGGGLLLALSRFLFPAFYAQTPEFLQPAVSSPLVIGLLGALVLNLVFRIGVRKSASVDFTPGIDPLSKLEAFAQRQGAIWGARRDVVDRAANAMVEAAECLPLLADPGTAGRMTMTFDEYWLDVRVEYQGRPLATAASLPNPDELLADETQLTRLSSVLLRRLATKLSTGEHGTLQRIHLGFEH